MGNNNMIDVIVLGHISIFIFMHHACSIIMCLFKDMNSLKSIRLNNKESGYIDWGQSPLY